MKQKPNAVQIIASTTKCLSFKPAAIRELMKKLDINEKGFAILMNVTPETVRLWGAAAVKAGGTAGRVMQSLNACPEVVNRSTALTEDRID